MAVPNKGHQEGRKCIYIYIYKCIFLLLEADLSLSPIERIMGEPTFMAFEISKDLPPRQEASDSRRTSFAFSKKRPPHPAKLAGLFAAMDLTLAAGAVNPVISKVLHSRDHLSKNRSKLNGRTQSVSFDSAEDALSKLANSVSALKPAVVGASILLPGLQNMTQIESKAQEAEQEPYYYSSAKELELRGRKVYGVASSSATATKEQSLSINAPDLSDGASAQFSTVILQNSRSNSQVSSSASELSRSASQASETISRNSNTVSQTSISSSIVKVSGITAIGEPIKLGYMQTTATIDGDDKPIYCTKAPRPKLNHNSSISESKSVIAATGLYRTIIGELPNVLSVHYDTDPEASRRNSDATIQSENESERSSKSCYDVMPCRTIGNSSQRDFEAVSRQRSLEKLRGEEDSKIDFKESNRQFINHSRTHPSVFRTSSKIRRQRQIDDSDDVFMDGQIRESNLHEVIRKTKSDISSVQVLNSRRMQIPVRYARSFDTHEGGASKVSPLVKSEVLHSGNEKRQRIVVSVARIKVNLPNTANNKHDFENNNNSDNNNDNNYNNNNTEKISEFSCPCQNTCRKTSSRSYCTCMKHFSNSSSPDDATDDDESPAVGHSWICEVSASPKMSHPIDFDNGDDLEVDSGADERQLRSRRLSQMSKREVRV